MWAWQINVQHLSTYINTLTDNRHFLLQFSSQLDENRLFILAISIKFLMTRWMNLSTADYDKDTFGGMCLTHFGFADNLHVNNCSSDIWQTHIW